MNQAFKQWQCFRFGFLDTETVVVTVWWHQTPDLTNTKSEKKVENLRSRSSLSKLPPQLSLSVLWLQNNTPTLSLDRHYFHPLLFFFVFSSPRPQWRWNELPWQCLRTTDGWRHQWVRLCLPESVRHKEGAGKTDRLKVFHFLSIEFLSA